MIKSRLDTQCHTPTRTHAYSQMGYFQLHNLFFIYRHAWDGPQNGATVISATGAGSTGAMSAVFASVAQMGGYGCGGAQESGSHLVASWRGIGAVTCQSLLGAVYQLIASLIWWMYGATSMPSDTEMRSWHPKLSPIWTIMPWPLAPFSCKTGPPVTLYVSPETFWTMQP